MGNRVKCGHCERIFNSEEAAKKHVMRCAAGPPDLLGTALRTCLWLVLAVLAGAFRFFAPRG